MFILSWKIDKCLYTANGAKNPQYKNTFKLLKTHDALRVRQPNSSTARVDCVLETEGCCGQLKCLSLDFLCRYGAETSADVQCISNIEERAQRKSDQPVLQMYCNWNDQRSSCQGLGGGKLVRYGRSTKKKNWSSDNCWGHQARRLVPLGQRSFCVDVAWSEHVHRYFLFSDCLEGKCLSGFQSIPVATAPVPATVLFSRTPFFTWGSWFTKTLPQSLVQPHWPSV